ncbi:hypothetical protein EG327_002286 [Venturia inaequalis]|uniref:Uncharacterized protein n=1 Tax=Venturia inaequalis TaxID=5025 RepID=A0A8H3VUR0_VENIN|nr:hypothetical protein EG327_002286 [Venturia inaequalis]
MTRFLHAGRNSYALVTGPSDGIGLAIARALAKSVFNIIIHGRNGKKLADIAKAISEQFPGIRIVRAVAAVTNARPATEQVVKAVATDGKEGRKLTVPTDSIGVMVISNAISSAALTTPQHAGGSPMINVGSYAGVFGLANINTYCGSKVFNHMFSEPLSAGSKVNKTDIEIVGMLVAEVETSGNPGDQPDFSTLTPGEMAEAILELRIKIYALCLDWNDINTHLRNLKRNVPSVQDAEKARRQCTLDLDSECHWCRNSPHMLHTRPASGKACLHGYRDSLLTEICPGRKTPSLLLVCKQITNEALGELMKKPLVLDWPYPLYGHPDLVAVFPLNHFINPRTLRKVPLLKIRTTIGHVYREVVQYDSGADLLGSWAHLQIMLKSEESDGIFRRPDLEIEMVDDSDEIATDTGILPFGVAWSTADAASFVKRIVLSLMTLWTMEYLRTSDQTSTSETVLEAGERVLEEWEKAPRTAFSGDMFCSDPAGHQPL